MVLDRRLDSWFCVSFTCEIVAVTTMDAATVVVSVAEVVLPAVDKLVAWAVLLLCPVCVDVLCS